MAYFLILVCCLQISAEWVSAITSQCHCNDCKVFPNNQCPVRQGSTRCKPNWFGNYCQKENIAFNKTSIQSSTYDGFYGGPYPAKYAVDGNTDNDINDNSCTHTNDTGNTGAWWKVTLSPNKQYNISYITIYFRKDLRERNAGFQLNVNNKVCPTRYYEQEELSVNCHSMSGNEVTIQITGPLLTLCEVQVFICSDGWFGDDCDKQCQCRNTSEVCDKETGYCRSGCRAGKQGDGCQHGCSDGYYGADCSSECGHCLNGRVCDKNSGHCDQNCQGQFQPPFCKECANGYYGEDCSSECGHCENGYGCNKTGGHCDQNCDGQFQPPFCKYCRDGWFGDYCDKQCQCRKTSEVCDKDTGYCRSGCRAGRQGGGCQEGCIAGKYGDNCSMSCGQCRNISECHKTTGICPNGCSRGYIQPFCIKECADYTYGDNCSGVCNCLNQCEVCDKVTGSCHTAYQQTTSTSSATSTAACTCTAQTIGLSVMGSMLAATCTSLAVMVLKYIKIKRRLTKYEAEKHRQYSTLTPGNTPIYDVITDSHQYANESINVQESQF